MSSFEHESEYGEYISRKLASHAWIFPDNDSLFPRPELVQLSIPERVKAIASLMRDCGGLLGEISYLSTVDDKKKGIDRLPFRYKITHSPGATPDVSTASFSFYRVPEMNDIGVEAKVKTPYKLEVGKAVSATREMELRQALYERDGRLTNDPIIDLFSYFFSLSGEGFVTFTPAININQIKMNTYPLPIAHAIREEALETARDNMQLLYQKAVVLRGDSG